ncbi:MAG: 16S rRNA (uracil(1498)-N(3))-methyltransferase [Gammaproteobacteria bacterium]|nr:16S rRNA (uracil(1498)-N(3))-methyltransferase [Gammaproteobacteria bacterium]
MRLSRIYHDQPLAGSTRATLGKSASRHLVRVLRLGVGARVIVFDGSGAEYPAIISEIGDARVAVALAEPHYPKIESPIDITLAQGLVRGERMDLILQKATELGVRRIIPVAMERCVTRLSQNRLEKRMRHWDGVVIGACEQSGRTVLPVIETMQGSAELIDNSSESEYALRLLLQADSATGINDTEQPPTGRILLWVGPEGGFAESESSAAIAKGFSPLRMGPRVLRTETAGLVALSLLQTRFGDLGL